MPVIITRFGRKRGTLECGLHDIACVANVIREGEGRAPNSLFFLLPSLPLPIPDVFCESLFFQIKMASAVKRSRTVALSAERVLQSLEQKGDGNNGMSSDEETSDIYPSRYKVSCVTVLLRKLAHNAFHFQIILLSSSGHSIYNSHINLSTLTETAFAYLEAFSISKAKTLKLYAMNRREET